MQSMKQREGLEVPSQPMEFKSYLPRQNTALCIPLQTHLTRTRGMPWWPHTHSRYGMNTEELDKELGLTPCTHKYLNLSSDTFQLQCFEHLLPYRFCMCTCFHLCTCRWSPEVKLNSQAPGVRHRSPCWPEAGLACQWAPGIPITGMPRVHFHAWLFLWMLQMELRSLYSKHLPNWAISRYFIKHALQIASLITCDHHAGPVVPCCW